MILASIEVSEAQIAQIEFLFSGFAGFVNRRIRVLIALVNSTCLCFLVVIYGCSENSLDLSHDKTYALTNHTIKYSLAAKKSISTHTR